MIHNRPVVKACIFGDVARLIQTSTNSASTGSECAFLETLLPSFLLPSSKDLSCTISSEEKQCHSRPMVG